MAQILLAATDDGVAVIKHLLGSKHQFTVVKTLPEAVAKLKELSFALTIVSVHFDESRMLDLLRAFRTIAKNANNPIISICTRETVLTRTMHESVDVTSKALGAWMYIDQNEFSVTKNPDGEMQRIIERCLTGEARKKTQEARTESHRQREELQRLREALESQEWSEELEDRIVELRRNLADTMLELCQSRLDTITQQESIASSEVYKDRVSKAVQLGETGALEQEQQLMTDDTNQTNEELDLDEREKVKRTEGRRKAKD